MHLKIVCLANDAITITTDELKSSSFPNLQTADSQIRRLYEGLGIQVLDILKIEEAEISISMT